MWDWDVPARLTEIESFTDLARYYGPSIFDVIEEDLCRIGEPFLEYDEDDYPFNPAKGFDPLALELGCGSFGCVYRLPYTDRWVFKLTRDQEEAAIVWEIMGQAKTRFHPGTALFAGVWRLEGPDGEYFLILREAVLPLTQASADDLRHHGVHIDTYAEGLLDTAKTLAQMYNDEDEPDVMLDYEEAVDDMSTVPVLAPLADLMMLLLNESDILIGDAWFANLGIRLFDLSDVFRPAVKPGPYVTLFDPGYSSTGLATTEGIPSLVGTEEIVANIPYLATP